ncbi:MAG: hypothetical protein RL757_180 [Bacteroidota bacterium]|jgi:plastocyanin
MKKILLSAFFFAAFQQTNAQINIANGSFVYTQDFNTLASTGSTTPMPSGWTISNAAGTSVATAYTVGTGSVATGALYSFGATSNSDRALGSIASGSSAPKIGVTFTNDGTGDITAMNVTYTGEMWRLGATGRADRLDFQYKINATNLVDAAGWTDVDNLDFSSPVTSGTTGAIDGNLTANRTTLSFSIATIVVPVGQSITFRWVDVNVSGSDDALSVDDFSVSSITMPVELTKFNAKAEQNNVSLTWSTASERDNSHFVVQHSTNGRDFADLAQVKGNGNTSSVSNYNFTHATATEGVNYYRLQQVDMNGKTTPSPVRSTVVGKNDVRIYPTVATQSLNLESASEAEQVFEIFNLQGQKVMAGAFTNRKTLDIMDLTTGIYVLKIGKNAIRFTKN